MGRGKRRPPPDRSLRPVFDQSDIEHLIEELRDMGKGEQRSLESRLRVLLAHLLKWQFQYDQLSERWREFDGRRWRITIIHQRTELKLLLRKQAGLQRLWPAAVSSAYADARELAAAESGLPIETFPAVCPYPDAFLLDDSFLPADESQEKSDSVKPMTSRG